MTKVKYRQAYLTLCKTKVYKIKENQPTGWHA